jgi:molybdenum cofactor cytidylyltransferase
MKISALILAAGSGTRIGTPKLMLEYKDKTFIRIIIDNLKSAGITDIVCVVSERASEWAKLNAGDCNVIVNPKPEKGMISSVYYGVKELKECDAVLIIPVDHPHVEEKTYKLLLMESERYKDSVIKPRFGKKSGHPIIVPFALIEKIREKDLSSGLDVFIKNSHCHQVYVELKDSGIIKNVNTLEDFSKL